MEKIRIIFFGSGSFGLATLKHLSSIEAVELVLVVTAPDRQSGRGFALQPDPVAAHCQQQNIPIFKPESLQRDSDEAFTSSRFDLGVVASYGKILPADLLALPQSGFLNVHPSLLPKYRGASPIAAALLDGAVLTGVTLIKMDAGIDTGPIVAQESIEILPDIKRDALEQLLIDCTGRLLDQALVPFARGEITARPQPDVLDRPTKKIKKSQGQIDWSNDADTIYRKFQAYYPWPGLWTRWNGQIVKLIDIKKLSQSGGGEPGTLRIEKNKQLIVTTLTQDISIKLIQISGKRIMTAEEFSNGYPSIDGARLSA